MNITNIPDHERICYQYAAEPIGDDWHPHGDIHRRLSPITKALAHAAVVCGVPTLTEDNAAELFARLRFLFFIGMSPLTVLEPDPDDPSSNVPVPYHFTPEDIKAHIGLEVETVETPTPAFMKAIHQPVLEHSAQLLDDADLSNSHYAPSLEA